MRLSRETPGTRFDTLTGGVNSREFLTIIFKVMRPSPKPGAISRIVPVGRQSRIRGRTVPDHCAAELPHGSDHSSPASFQSYFVEWLGILGQYVAGAGIEPATRGFSVHCSTN